MKTIEYSPLTLGYVVNPTAKQVEQAQRVSLIEDINTIQCMIGKQPLTTTQFEEFMSSPLEYLMSIVRDQSSLLRIHI